MTDAVMDAYGVCVRCSRFFGFDPQTVPSTSVHLRTRCTLRPNGTEVKPGDADAMREPLCPACAEVFRKAGGQPRPMSELFPHALLQLVDITAAIRIQAGMNDPGSAI